MTTAETQPKPIALPDPEESYRLMLTIREFEDQCYHLFIQNLIHGTMHLGIGQEGVAAGVEAALRPDDYVLSTYRGHAHVIGRGASLPAAMGEMMGRENGLCKGKGGSMHLTDVERGALGSYAIVGAHLPIGCGTAWSSKLRGTDQVTVCFFGDGATNIGAFHEALNLAAVWALPVIFVCENNLYMEFTPIGHVTAVPHPAADRASAYGLPSIIVDGNNVEAMYATTKEAVDRARAGEGPSLIEALTYRHKGHSRTDPGKYRTADEVESWMQRDPIPAFRRRLEESGYPPDKIDEIERQVVSDVQAAVDEALAAPTPGSENLLRDVWCSDETTWLT